MSRYFDDDGNLVRDSAGLPVTALTERHETERLLGRELTDDEWDALDAALDAADGES